MKFISITIIIFSLNLCSHQSGFDRFTEPVISFKTEVDHKKTSIFKRINFNIYIEEVTNEKWTKMEKFLSLNVNKKDKFPIPPLPFYQILVKNKNANFLKIGDIKVNYKDSTSNNLDINQIKDNLKQKAYLFFDHKKFNFLKIYTKKEYHIDKINYNKIIILKKEKYIAKNESGILFVLFRPIPIQYREYEIIIEIFINNISEKISFGFIRKEYRSTGKYFLKPKSAIDYLIDE
jgi:hypothetical protein